MSGTDPMPSQTSPAESAGAVSHEQEEEDRGYDVPAKAWFVHGAIIVAFALFVGILALLYVRWDSRREPNASMVFVADERLDGAQVTVDSPRIDNAITQTISKDSNYEARFPLPAGTYLVRITRDGRPVVPETSLTAYEGVPMLYDLRKLMDAAATRPVKQGLGAAE